MIVCGSDEADEDHGALAATGVLNAMSRVDTLLITVSA